VPGDPTPRWWAAQAVAVPAGALLVLGAPGLAIVGLAVAAVAVAAGSPRDTAGPAVEPVAVIEALVGPLAAGATLGGAVDRVVAHGGQPADALEPVARAVADGAPVQQALDGWAADVDDDRLRLVTDAVAVAGSSGGSLARALLGAGETLREREALRRELCALGSQARASALVLVAVPIAFTAVVAVADRRVGAFLLMTPAGWACLLAGLVADGVGWWWMRRLIGSVA